MGGEFWNSLECEDEEELENKVQSLQMGGTQSFEPSTEEVSALTPHEAEKKGGG